MLKLDPSLASSVYKNQPDKGQQPIADGQTFSVPGATVTAVFTPGHAHDHMCFWLHEENALFTGDNVLGHGTTVVEDLGVYMASLTTMQARACTRGYPGHGDMISDLRAKLAGYIAQRVRREKRILAALKGLRGGATVFEVVAKVHGDAQDVAVRDAVLVPYTKEVLGKLEGEGRIRSETVRRREAETVWFAT